jgi:hypothetical protein
MLLWIVALVVTRGGQTGVLSGALLPEGVATGLVTAVMLAALGVALALRRRALRAAERAGARGTSRASAIREAMVGRENTRRAVKSSLFYAWVTLDVAGFVCGVVFIMMATRLMLLIALPLFLLGVALTFPRARWYGGGSADE